MLSSEKHVCKQAQQNSTIWMCPAGSSEFTLIFIKEESLVFCLRQQNLHWFFIFVVGVTV
jgi:hypothetical protein